MVRVKNILLAVDVTVAGLEDGGELPSEFRSAVEGMLGALGYDERAQLRVATVLPAGSDAELVQLARQRIEARVLPLLPGVQPDIHVCTGHPVIELIQLVYRHDIDLVAVGARSGPEPRDAIVGSTAMGLVRKCPCMVWVAPRQLQPSRPRIVLSSVAFHEQAQAILEVSAMIVAKRGGTWNVMHVAEYPGEGAMRLRGVPYDEVEAYEKELRGRAWDELHGIVDPIAEQYGVAPKLWMTEGLPSEQIIKAARELQCDLLVMGTIGRSGLPGLVVGNTADKIFADIHCSVLAVKPASYVSPIPPA